MLSGATGLVNRIARGAAGVAGARAGGHRPALQDRCRTAGGSAGVGRGADAPGLEAAEPAVLIGRRDGEVVGAAVRDRRLAGDEPGPGAPGPVGGDLEVPQPEVVARRRDVVAGPAELDPRVAGDEPLR